MAEAERRWGRPASGRNAILTLVVFLLIGLVVWLLAERNARRFALVLDEGTLFVKKGILFPVGTQRFRTDDPSAALAYAPIKPPPGAKLDEERTFEDRTGLDQALYELFARWAREEIATERPEAMERALPWLARAEKLANISPAQREDLRNLRAETGFFEARQLLDRGADMLRQARERLRITASSPSPHAAEAGEAAHKLEPVVDEVHQAVRLLARPEGQRAAEPPAPAPAATPSAGSPAPTPSSAPSAAAADGGTR